MPKNIASMDIYEVIKELEAFNKAANSGHIRTPTEQKRYEVIHRAYKAKRKEWQDNQLKEYNNKAKQATGLKEGDYVGYTFVSPFGLAENFMGVVAKYRGKLRVKLDEKHNGKRYVAIHKGWKRIKR